MSPGQCSNHDHVLPYVFQKSARVVMVILWLLGDLEGVEESGLCWWPRLQFPEESGKERFL